MTSDEPSLRDPADSSSDGSTDRRHTPDGSTDRRRASDEPSSERSGDAHDSELERALAAFYA